MTLDEIKKAVDAGHTVHWSNPAYTVIADKLKSGKVQYLVAYKRGTRDAYFWGLTHTDDVTVNGEPHEFYIARPKTRPAQASNSLVVPTVNLNGTGRGDLVQQQVDILAALTDLGKAMSKAYPHGRDYQLAPDTYAAARAAWDSRCQIVEKLHREITAHAFAIDQQGKD